MCRDGSEEPRKLAESSHSFFSDDMLYHLQNKNDIDFYF